MKRAKFYLPNQCRLISAEIYTSECFYIGATICLNGFLFRLFDADEFTLSYMESHASQYPMANIDVIMNKIRNALNPIRNEFMSKYLKHESKKLNDETTVIALRDILGENITDHEVVTFLRHFDADKSSDGKQSYHRLTIQSVIQRELMKNFWDDVEGLEHRIHSSCPINPNIKSKECVSIAPTMFSTPEQLKIIIKSCRIPIKDDLIQNMFTVYDFIFES